MVSRLLCILDPLCIEVVFMCENPPFQRSNQSACNAGHCKLFKWSQSLRLKVTKNPFETKASTSGCVIGLAYRCKSGVLMQSRAQNPRAFWQAGDHFWHPPADQRARGFCVRKLSTAYLVPANALEKWVRLNLLTTTDFSSHQSADQITGGNRERTENGKKYIKINC